MEQNIIAVSQVNEYIKFLLDRDELLTNICADRVFLADNAHLVSQVGWCCATVCVITAVAGCFYPALLFICLIMLFLWLLMKVVASVLSAAAALREENDLTI